MKKIALLLIALAAMIGVANAGTVVSSDISGNVTWTKAGMPYHLDKQIFVLPNSSLTIEAGVVVASFAPKQGSLAVCRGAQIFVNGTKEEPVVMTSAEDVATWDGSVVTRDGVAHSGYPDGYVDSITTLGDPKTGYWRAACGEWGNLTIMGSALISASKAGKGGARAYVVDYNGRTNTDLPDGLNQKDMEGFAAAMRNDSKIWYGGNNDNDDSGSIHYLSLRYGGKVIGLANELNGLSIGGLGRGTDIDFVEIMNNVDDGIEIWGGTVNLSHVSIWNIGDDSLDTDEGWRGTADYGLIVQGYSVDAVRGSGVGDNCFEFDGAEASDAQPVSTSTIKHFTVVGQPSAARGGTAWRDNNRTQYDNCIWIEVGMELVRADNSDGDGAEGYGYNGTLSWANTWTTSYNTWAASAQAQINLGTGNLNSIYANYIGQDLNGNLAQITNSVFYHNTFATAYTEAIARGVLADGTTMDAANGTKGNMIKSTLPIQKLYRDDVTLVNGHEYPVTYINPLPKSGVTAGGFKSCNWIAGWSAAYAYQMTENTSQDSGDLNCDGSVNLNDLSSFASQWLL